MRYQGNIICGSVYKIVNGIGVTSGSSYERREAINLQLQQYYCVEALDTSRVIDLG